MNDAPRGWLLHKGRTGRKNKQGGKAWALCQEKGGLFPVSRADKGEVGDQSLVADRPTKLARVLNNRHGKRKWRKAKCKMGWSGDCGLQGAGKARPEEEQRANGAAER